MEAMITQYKAEKRGKISDGYHTFDELYAHRIALFMALMKLMPEESWKALQHSDGTMFPGQFVAGLLLSQGYITYHLPIYLFAGCPGNELVRAPEWDGHTSDDVVARLLDFAGTSPGYIVPLLNKETSNAP